MQMLKSAAKKQPNEDDEDVKEFDAESWPFKDADLARQNREDGNAAFQSGSYELALLLYTEAMRYGPVHPSTLEGEDFAAAAANRSAALFQLEKYQECLQELCCQMTLSFAFLGFFFLRRSAIFHTDLAEKLLSVSSPTPSQASRCGSPSLALLQIF
jgi:hypothetical protein